MRLKSFLPLVGLSALSTGCFLCYAARNLVEAPINVADEWCMGHRNKRLAWNAWEEVRKANPTQRYSAYYIRGFKDGFVDYLDAGGNGEPPVAPPWCYRSSKYQTPRGYLDIQEWFAGFRHGAAVARTSGYREIFVLPLALNSQPLDFGSTLYTVAPLARPPDLPAPRPVPPAAEPLPLNRFQPAPAPEVSPLPAGQEMP